MYFGCASDILQNLFLGNLQGKVIWVTGASSGIGEFMAIEFARNGAKIILSARSETNLERVKGRCLGENCNLFHLITKNKTNYFFLKKKHYNQLLKILD